MRSFTILNVGAEGASPSSWQIFLGWLQEGNICIIL